MTSHARSRPRSLILCLVRSMKHSVFIVALFIAFHAASAQNVSSTLRAAQAKAVAIYAPAPDYPIEARQQRFTGRGVAVLEVHPKTGYVIAAHMEKSTGHAMLDHAALAAFTRWRFKPGTMREIRIPINYTFGKRT